MESSKIQQEVFDWECQQGFPSEVVCSDTDHEISRYLKVVRSVEFAEKIEQEGIDYNEAVKAAISTIQKIDSGELGLDEAHDYFLDNLDWLGREQLDAEFIDDRRDRIELFRHMLIMDECRDSLLADGCDPVAHKALMRKAINKLRSGYDLDHVNYWYEEANKRITPSE